MGDHSVASSFCNSCEMNGCLLVRMRLSDISQAWLRLCVGWQEWRRLEAERGMLTDDLSNVHVGLDQVLPVLMLLIASGKSKVCCVRLVRVNRRPMTLRVLFALAASLS